MHLPWCFREVSNMDRLLAEIVGWVHSRPDIRCLFLSTDRRVRSTGASDGNCWKTPRTMPVHASGSLRHVGRGCLISTRFAHIRVAVVIPAFAGMTSREVLALN